MAGRQELSSHEAAFLLKCYLDAIENNIPMSHMAKDASEALRHMAVNSGMKIDDTYRSAAGIANRLVSVGNAYNGVTTRAIAGTKAFAAVVTLYKNQHDEYERLLSEAMAMIAGQQTGKDLFFAWAEGKLPEKQQNESKKEIEAKIYTDVDITFSLSSIPNLTYTKPVSYSYRGAQREIVTKWTALYISVLRRFDKAQISKIRSNFGDIDFSENDNSMRHAVEIWPGVYTEMNYSANDLVKKLKLFFECCGMDPAFLIIEYRNSNAGTGSAESIPDQVRKAIISNYCNGLRFDKTVLRLLSEQAHTKLNDALVKAMQTQMFKRADGLYFLTEMVADDATLARMKANVLNGLQQHGLCEPEVLYHGDSLNISSTCIRNAADYGDFLVYLMPDSVRAVNVFGTKVLKPVDVTTNEAVATISEKLVATIKEQGCMTEDDLLIAHPVITGAFLKKILEKGTDEIISTVINGILCYQTIEAMGFDEGFSETLSTILDKACELNLMPTQETLHVLLSIEIGQNFNEAYGIPDDKTFRRVITMYYTGETPRSWKAGKFMEE